MTEAVFKYNKKFEHILNISGADVCIQYRSSVLAPRNYIEMTYRGRM